DVAVTLADYSGCAGEAMAIGERTPVAALASPAACRLAVAEALTNILAADVRALGDVKLSANWMAACGEPGQDAELYASVRAIGEELCPALGIAIPVGKDSLSMRTTWTDGAGARKVIAPVSLIVSAFAPVGDVRRTLTPQLRLDVGPTELLLIDFGAGRDRLGGTALLQVYGALGDEPADFDRPRELVAFAAALRELRDAGLVLAYHDRADGGVAVTLLEMAFAGGCGLDVALPVGRGGAAGALFSEEIGVVMQVRRSDLPQVRAVLARFGLDALTHPLGAPTVEPRIRLRAGAVFIDEAWTDLRRAWSETSWRMRRLRDDPQCADEEYAAQCDLATPPL
ncbi:MAG: AIR synthase-related protein, partial [Steroidobacteraceae bacterium]|nr:AIR synthase-related protein [Steroidobacteraceae bacterium]